MSNRSVACSELSVSSSEAQLTNTQLSEGLRSIVEPFSFAPWCREVLLCLQGNELQQAVRRAAAAYGSTEIRSRTLRSAVRAYLDCFNAEVVRRSGAA